MNFVAVIVDNWAKEQLARKKLRMKNSGFFREDENFLATEEECNSRFCV
ncbi:hypothetical protein [Emticicia sp. C21]|nr:hypothetical protein [Emticicia sp. C21]